MSNARHAFTPLMKQTDVAAMDPFERLAHRIKYEYLEMPGLSLTLRQAERMWQLRQSECEHVLSILIDSGFLIRTAGGAFVLAGSGRAGA